VRIGLSYLLKNELGTFTLIWAILWFHFKTESPSTHPTITAAVMTYTQSICHTCKDIGTNYELLISKSPITIVYFLSS